MWFRNVITVSCVQSTFIVFRGYMTFRGVLSTQTPLLCGGPPPLPCNSWRKVVLCLPWWELTGPTFPSHQLETAREWANHLGLVNKMSLLRALDVRWGCKFGGNYPRWWHLWGWLQRSWWWHWYLAVAVFFLKCSFCKLIPWMWLVNLVLSLGADILSHWTTF